MGHALLANNNADISEPQLRKLLREIEANSEEIVARWEVMAKVNMTLRVDPELKIEAAKLFKELGMDLSTATGIFYRQALRHHGIPFDICLDEPNETTYAAMEEAEQMLRDTNARKFSSVDELFGELDS